MSKSRWHDKLNMLLGIWLFFSPFVLMFSTAMPAAAMTAYAMGVLIALFAFIAMTTPHAWEEAVGAVLGFLTLVSPWVVGYATHTVATLNAAAVGVVVLVLAALAMVKEDEFRKWLHLH